MRFFTFLLLVLLPWYLAGQSQIERIEVSKENSKIQSNPEVSLHGPENYICILAGRVFNGIEMAGEKSIVIRNGIIEALLEPGVQPPPGAEIIDARDCTIMPGLFDGHIHFMGSPIWQAEGVDRYGWGKMAKEAYSLFPQHRMSLLANGVTTIIDMGSPVDGYEHLRRAYNKEKIAGPEIYYPGPLFTAPKGHPAGTIYKGQHDLIANGTVQIDDELKACMQVRNLNERHVDFIKIVYDRMWYVPGGAPRLDLNVARAIIDEAHSHGLRVFAHVGSEEEAYTMVNEGVDGIEHSFGSSDSVEILFEAMIKRKVAFTPTLIAYVHYAPKAVKPMMATVKKASDAGVMLVLGTDFPVSYGRHCGDDVYEEMKLLEEAGVPRLNILRAATLNAAVKIGRDKEIGMVKEGYRANLVVMKGNVEYGPLSQDRVERVILNGNTVFENQQLVSSCSGGFREKHILPIPYFFWDPVTDFNLGLSLTDFDLIKSGISMNGDLAFSFRNMWASNLQFAVPTPIPKTRVKTIFHFDNSNRIFYGIGNSTRKEDGIEYGSLFFSEELNTVSTFARHWKLSETLAADQIRLHNYSGNSIADIEGMESVHQVRLGVMGGYDARDHENNPWRGWMVLGGGELSPAWLGPGRTYGNIKFDIRGFISPFFRNIIAARILYKQAFGEVPLYLLPDYGGQATGRGFFPRRYTDRVALCGQLEYRFPVYKIISGAAWIDEGQVQPGIRNFSWKFHPAFGMGPRFAFGSNENSILAVDAGFSNEGWVLYFRSAHSF